MIKKSFKDIISFKKVDKPMYQNYDQVTFEEVGDISNFQLPNLPVTKSSSKVTTKNTK